MLKEGCPGSKEIRNPYPEELICPLCGQKNEIWTDEPDTICQGCQKTINREMKPNCLLWCPAAKECVGSKKYDRLVAAYEEQGKK